MLASNTAGPSLDTVMAYQHPRLLNRLVEKVGMEPASAHEMFEDTKRFLYLCAVVDEPLAPTEQIDEVWHNFILYTRDYATFCQSHFGFMIHHVPWNKAEVAQSDGTIVKRTRAAAEAVFGPSLSSHWEYAEHPGSCGVGKCGASTNCQDGRE
jgi:hypothetical protein